MSKPYKPPDESLPVLENIPSLITGPGAKVLPGFGGQSFVCVLPGGQLYFESALQLDSDGSVYSKQDKTGQAHTSTRYVIDDRSMDADNDNFFVLPGGFYSQFGIAKGDIGVVIYKARKVFACFGDVGPSGKLGEGSIALHRALGHETVIGGRLQNVGISGRVVTIVFPGSGDTFAKKNNESRQLGDPLFKDLLKKADSHQWSQLSRWSTREIVILGDRADVEDQLLEWMEDVALHTPPVTGRELVDAAMLVRTATGIDKLMEVRTPMSLPPPGSRHNLHKRTVYARFYTDERPDGRRFVNRVHFSLTVMPGQQTASAGRP